MATIVLDEKSLNLAGWLSVVSAVLVLPLSAIGFFTGWFAMEDDLGAFCQHDPVALAGSGAGPLAWRVPRKAQGPLGSSFHAPTSARRRSAK